jgi:hypothetical protein
MGIFTGTDAAANCGATIVGSQPFLAPSLLETGGPLAVQISKVGKCLWDARLPVKIGQQLKDTKYPTTTRILLKQCNTYRADRILAASLHLRKSANPNIRLRTKKAQEEAPGPL